MWLSTIASSVGEAAALATGSTTGSSKASDWLLRGSLISTVSCDTRRQRWSALKRVNISETSDLLNLIQDINDTSLYCLNLFANEK